MSLTRKLFSRSLSSQMSEVNSLLDQISSELNTLSLRGSHQPLPERAPFGWVRLGRPIGPLYPALEGERMEVSGLTPEQMAYCIQHLEELEAWAEQVSELNKPAPRAQRRVNRLVRRVSGVGLGLWMEPGQEHLPVRGEFGWVVLGSPIGMLYPALKGERLAGGELTPQQMAYCQAHLSELRAWARECEDLKQEILAEKARRRRAEYQARAEARQAQQAREARRFHAEVEARLS